MSATRSQSVPAKRSAEREDLETDDENTAFPVLPQESTTDPRVPSWIQELADARSYRHSRASSIVSTRTRFSTTTFDDARSIDIQAGGHTFRISRFGDRVVDTTAPPPYSGPSEDDVSPHRTAGSPSEALTGDRERPHFHRHFHGHHPPGPATRRQPRRVRIAMPDHEGTTNANDDDSLVLYTPSREPTNEELRQIILDLPSRLKTVLGIDAERFEGETSTAADEARLNGEPGNANEIVRGALMRGANTGSVQDDRSSGSGYVRGILRNAPSRTPHHTNSIILDRGEIRWLPSDQRNQHSSMDERGRGAVSLNLESMHLASSDTITAQIEDADIPPTIGDINELSEVYSKVMRDLDREHRKLLHDRDKEMDQLRILLHEKDIVYRQQLKGRDFVIEDLKRRLDHLEETMELRLERARNEVEDLWETRWREHQTQLMGKLGLIKPAWQTHAEGTTQTDDSDVLTV